jgi:uncharacterized protein (TIGR02600 family)
MEQNLLTAMNTSTTLKSHSPRTSGVALVIVLSIIVLLSALLVAFMSSVSTESASAKAAVRGIEARQVAESALNLAISQIRDATRGDAVRRAAWASQPGLIRQFDENGGEGLVYKLYTAAEMIVGGGAFPPGVDPKNQNTANANETLAEAGIIPGKFEETPTAFTDLNEPVIIPVPGKPSDVYVRYPIADPRAAEAEPGIIPSQPNTRIAGFNVLKINHPDASLKDAGQFAASDKRVRLLPMRARWLFQLRDGTLVPGVAKNPGTNDGVMTVAGATETNPIVGRFAFWADDETAKLNVNTATENTFWDTPHASTIQESGRITTQNLILDGNGNPAGSGSPSLALAAAQPARGEYQRFPGHPATTGLSPAMRWLYSDIPTTKEWQFKEEIYRLAPRVIGGQGSSVGGTQITEYRTDQRIYERDRLLTSLDEYWFRPDRTPLSMQGLYPVFSANTKDNAKASDRFTPEAIEMMRFFMTASNRSPDLNLWGLPRVSIWPIHSNDASDPKVSRRSGFDDLIAFCSSTGKPGSKKNYYFSRYHSWSPTEDINPISPIPNIKRNTELLSYLTKLTDKKVPGVGVSFASKYNTAAPASYNSAKGVTERDQILTQIFDYIRCINLVDTGRKDGSAPPPTGVASYPLAYTPGYGSLNGNSKPNLGSGQVVPAQRFTDNFVSTMGFGRFPTVSEVAIVFYQDRGPKIFGDDSDAGSPPPAGQTATHTRAVILLETNCVAPGYPALSEGYAVRITEVTPFTVKTNANDTAAADRPLELGSGQINRVEVDSWRGPYGRFFMPTRGFGNAFWYDNVMNNPGAPVAKEFWRPGATNPPPPAGGDKYAYYPFFSKRFVFGGPSAAQEFLFTGGQMRIEILPLNVPISPTAAASLAPFHPVESLIPLQIINVDFGKMGPVRLKIPTSGTDFQTRIKNLSSRGDSNVALGWIDAGDTVRSMELNGVAKGDIRLAAARPVVPQEMFTAAISDAEYRNPATQRVHNLRLSWGARYTGARQGVLSLGATQRGDKVVDVPAQYAATGVPLNINASITGDFDRGLSKHIDGAFINRPDEGNTRFNFSDSDMAGGGGIPYYRGGNGYEETGQTYFSPNRLISSAVMFGSLPTGQFAMQPWQTLLFRPGYANHKGMQKPADHYLLDLFHMPVVEPYAISEPLSTNGRVNLNTRIAPYGYVPATGTGNPITAPAYIERTTALHGVFKGMYQMAIPNGTPEAAHSETPLTGAASQSIIRWPINPYKTIAEGIIKKNYFKTASEICDIDLIMDGRTLTGNPTAGSSASNRSTFWEAHNMTGDNMRERPYSHIYPRLTTKSNTFTVHVRAQSVSKRTRKNWDTFDETDDLITGEYRGSSTIERFIDPNDDDIKDFDAVKEIEKEGSSLENYYRFRVINTKQFTAR